MLGSAVLLLLVTVVLCLLSRARRVRRESRWLPPELRRATLAFAERLFKSHRPALVARVDRAYRRDGRIVLLELKTRPHDRVYASDIVELSAQRLAVEAQTREQVDTHGYVLTARSAGGHRKLHLVTLMSREDVERLIVRRERILDGRDKPRYASDRRLCRGCGFRKECRPPHEA